MNIKLIEFFNVEIPNKNEMVDPIELNAAANKVGYLVHPDACTKDVLNFINSKQVNYNSTFFKDWRDVMSKSREEIFVNQLIHYITAAYSDMMGGPRIDENFVWVPEGECIVPNIESYRLILPVTEKNVFEKCSGVVYSGIALDTVTREVLCEFICNNIQKYAFNIDDVKNREAQAVIAFKSGVLPKDPIAMLRCIVYSCCYDTMLINSNEFFTKLKYPMNHPGEISLNVLDDMQLQALSTIFNRYKYVFMALKHRQDNSAAVNKIRKYAKKYHKPMTIGLWESILYNPIKPDEVVNQLMKGNLTNYKIIQMIQSIRENKQMISSSDDVYKMFIIRNKKTFVKKMSQDEIKKKAFELGEWWNWLEEVFMHMLKYNLTNVLYNNDAKKKVVKYPKYLNLACPVSEKNFIGNIPFGSYYTLTNNNYVSVYWREEWGTRDFDLSFCNYNGEKIGWNASFKIGADEVLYSGDMVTANPEAAEVILMQGQYKGDGLFYVNRYNGISGSKYKLAFGQDNSTSIPKNYMVDPNTIQLETEVISPENMQQMIGAKLNDRLYLCQFDFGNIRVSKAGEREAIMKDIMYRKSQSFLSVKEVLDFVGFEEYDPEKHDKVDIDLTDLKKDTLISLFNEI